MQYKLNELINCLNSEIATGHYKHILSNLSDVFDSSSDAEIIDRFLSEDSPEIALTLDEEVKVYRHYCDIIHKTRENIIFRNSLDELRKQNNVTAEKILTTYFSEK